MVLGVDSHYDEFTRGGWSYRERNVYPYLESKGLRVQLVSGEAAVPGVVWRELANPDVRYLTGVGHGLHDRYKGHQGQNLFRVGEYADHEPMGKIVHLAACDTALRLGPDFVLKGCLAFFGYEGSFYYPARDEPPDVLDRFFACDSEIDLAFADGLSAEEVYARVREKYTLEVARLRESGRRSAAKLLQKNRDCLRAPSSGKWWGDPRARVRGGGAAISSARPSRKLSPEGASGAGDRPGAHRRAARRDAG